ncbi:family 43 glycosylhydrolase [Bacteroides sp.]|uniref:family 43 glycosylhydrolase n=1 Tax=Bacteroides sp. TaxID=29523 RepID=UPI003A91C119
MKQTITWIIALLMCSLSAIAQKKNVNNKPYPYGNPVIRHLYSADAAPRVMPDGRVWMVTSIDDENKPTYNNMHSYHTFSSADMVNWTDHGEVLHLRDVIPNEPEGEDWALWAPDMIYKDGKYYLYFPIRILKEGQKSAITWTAVAVSDHPARRFKVIQPRIPGTKGIDPAVFRDDDGETYLYFGPRLVATLANNMTEFSSPVKTLELDATKTLDNEAFRKMWTGKSDNKKFNSPNYMEAPWMHKRNGIYYFNYHTQYGSDVKSHTDDPTRRKSHLDYSIGNSPWGPLNYAGTLNKELGIGVDGGPRSAQGDFVPWRLTQSNHGGIVEYHGKDYLFYHTSALSSWRQDEFKAEGTWTQRSVCIDEIQYDESGHALPVKQTLEGPAPVEITQAFDIVLAAKAQLKNSQAVFRAVNLGSGYYYFDTTLPQGNHTGKLEIHLDSPEGMLVGTCLVTPEKLRIRQGLTDTSIRDAKGQRDIYLIWKGTGTPPATLENPRFFAGSPKKLNP